MELEWSKNGECFGLSLNLHVQNMKAFCFISASSTTFPHATSTARSNEPMSRDRLEVRPIYWIYWLFESLGPAWIIVRNKKQEARDVIQVQCQKKTRRYRMVQGLATALSLQIQSAKIFVQNWIHDSTWFNMIQPCWPAPKMKPSASSASCQALHIETPRGCSAWRSIAKAEQRASLPALKSSDEQKLNKSWTQAEGVQGCVGMCRDCRDV